MDPTPDLDFVSGDFWGRDPHAGLTWLRENAPVWWNQDGDVWGITKYDDVKQISKHPDTWSSAGGIRPDSGPTGMMIEQDDPVHWQRRKLVNKGFTPQQVRAQEDKVRAVVDRLIDDVIDQLLSLDRVHQQLVHATADHVARGLVAADQDQECLHDE